MEKFFCLYTHQKTKKKKTWYDGEIVINSVNSKCVLYSRDGSDESHKALGTIFLSKDQVGRIVTQGSDELEFENYLVHIEFSKVTYDAPALVKELRTSSFAVPSVLSRAMPKKECFSASSVPTMKDLYTVTDEELDEIWAFGGARKRQKYYEDQQEHATNIIAEVSQESQVVNNCC